MNKQITVTVNGKRMLCAPCATLSEIIGGERPCGGHGKCGKCRVIAKGHLSDLTDTERKLLTDNELSLGVRLACLTRAMGDCEVDTQDMAERAQIVADGALPQFEINPSFEKYGVVIDIGTTTLAARLYSSGGKLLSGNSRENPQKRWAADVISRVEAAIGGKAEALALAIRDAIDGMIRELAQKADIDVREIDGAVITGNTVMLSLLAEESVEPFSHAPFAAKRLFGEEISAGELGLSSLLPGTHIYLPPCISAFVGADITCAILSTELCRGDDAMLADIGTNGEIALWSKGSITVCSTAAGPAFEGVGITMGMRGAMGAIDKVSLENGSMTAHVIGDITPKGICGSGLVDAVACMLDLEIIDESGYLEDDKLTILPPVYFAPKDIRMLQLAKSAICAGILTLIKTAKIEINSISKLYIAGGFGCYLNLESASRIGLIPRAMAKMAETVGNAALGGAVMLLLNRGTRAEAEKVAENAVTVELSSNPIFSNLYMSGMLLEEA